MTRPEIVRLFGHADSLPLEFHRSGGAKWTCEVPPDLDDGVYAVEITAVNAAGLEAYWTGELFMRDGRGHVNLRMPQILIWVKPHGRPRTAEEAQHEH